jgi:RimJ/RimL family protein N-acetyltransferase
VDSGVHLRPLAGDEAELAELQRVLEGSPRYFEKIRGEGPAADEAHKLWSALPEGRSIREKTVFGMYAGGQLVGCAELVRGYPAPDTAIIGLLVVHESHQRRGLGTRALLQLEHALRGFPEIRRLRLGVMSTNPEAMHFWTGLGFAATGEKRPHHEGKVSSILHVFEKPLSEWIMETERLRLRRFRRGDLDDLAAMLGDWRTMKHYPSVRDRDGARAWLEDAVASYRRWNHGLWVLIERDTGEFAGQVGLVVQTLDTGPAVEIGYMVRRQRWGRGYAPEAGRACLAHARRVFGYRKVIALIDPANTPSQRVAQKLGLEVKRRTTMWDRELDVWGADLET